MSAEQNPEGRRFERAYAIASDLSINREGRTRLGIMFTGTSEEAIERLSDYLKDRLGLVGAEGDTNTSFFAFSERSWNAPWEPKGPKPSWQRGDPRKN